MFVLNYEHLKEYVIGQIRDFYSENIHFEERKMVCEESLSYAMAGGQTLIYYINAYITLISDILGVCFSLGAIIAERETSRTNALYMLARSLALACAAAIPVCRNEPTILFVVTAIMLIVQIVDCIIGIIIKSKMRTAGPFIMAVCHAACLFLSI